MTIRNAYAQSMGTLGQALCMQSRFKEGLLYLRKAIQYEAKHTGEGNQNLIHKLLNAGRCVRGKLEEIDDGDNDDDNDCVVI